MSNPVNKDKDKVKVILTDIEGTTSSIAFVKDTLFPYAAEHLPAFIQQHMGDTTVQQQLKAAATLINDEGGNVDATDVQAMASALLAWISMDRKATPLKALQGMIWEHGYQNGDYQAHMYPDATDCLQQWHTADIPLYVYSSGSVRAQELFFRFSQDGNLLPLFAGHFDTRVGAKQDTESYQKIVAQLSEQHDITAANVLFLSDIEAELDAARNAGLQTVWLVRESPVPSEPSPHPIVTTFDDIQLR